MKENKKVSCNKCDDLTEHKLLIETKICEEWECTKCGNTRLFGK